MFTKLTRWFSRFFNKSSTINNEPINKVSLIIVIAIDLFILGNVFWGLSDIGQWHLSAGEQYPCYYAWDAYRTETPENKDFETIRSSIQVDEYGLSNPYPNELKRLGSVSEVCLNYRKIQDRINTPANQQVIRVITEKQTNINDLEYKNQRIRSQYDSTLLEQIAGQPRDLSINTVEAAQAKQNLEENNRQIASIKGEISTIQEELLAQPASVEFLALLNDDTTFNQLQKDYKHAAYWYPSLQFALQAAFLLPLIVLALWVHNFAQRKNYGLVALMSWHLLIIFCIPLILKIFEVLQFGIIFDVLVRVLTRLLGGLLFLISYVYILIVPLVGFGIIKFFQKVVFNRKLQVTNRVQKGKCMNCGKKLRGDESHCPHCGYYQYVECPNCLHLTYKYLSYCKVCGHPQTDYHE
ncbi:zinc ribbon domain-containing protein [Spirulina subsalsa]|uniref:zinc ribbon domain-containing protein n=1 Tax=Spirulina subsalsa TaxID=54311 RepID=UPI000306C8BF|nr:zinc ribbon domain-containing protein [Spirulina subsalsa]